MDPTVRLLRLVAALQQRREWSSDDLAQHLDVTSRTVRRDISRLRELGYAVDATPGRGGGYRLRAGKALPPLVLSDDEAVVLAVGLRVATLTGVSGSGESAVSALAKLEGLLPGRLRAHVTALGADVISLTGGGQATTDPAVLAALAIACRREEHVALTYTDTQGRVSRRDVAAYRVVHADRRWYLVAHDVRRSAWRTFRIDRVSAAVPLGGQATFVDPPDPAALVAEGVTTTVYRWAATIRLHLAHHEAARRVPPTVGRLLVDTDTTTILRIGADDLDWLARYLVGLTCDLEVLDPPRLVGAINELGNKLRTTGPRLQV
ncbi:MAG TPA: YafY family protein [Euzebya sp.]|nr:YafY family protein [Euzebya sp.]